jgi:hypothetical protein
MPPTSSGMPAPGFQAVLREADGESAVRMSWMT